MFKFHIDLNCMFKFQVYLKTSRKLFKLSITGTGTSGIYVALVKPDFLFYSSFGMVFDIKWKKMQQCSYPYLQAMFHFFEQCCIYPFHIYIAMSYLHFPCHMYLAVTHINIVNGCKKWKRDQRSTVCNRDSMDGIKTETLGRLIKTLDLTIAFLL